MSQSEISPWVWLDGVLVDQGQAHISVQDRGFTLGDGLFETMFWTGHDVRFLDDHLQRLTRSAAALDINMPMSAADIGIGLSALGETLKGASAAIRLTLTRGVGPRGLALPQESQPRLLATIAPYSPPATALKLATLSITRNPSAPSAHFKTLSYIDNVLALREALTLGAHDGLWLGPAGQAACASSANVIFAIDGDWLTPPCTDGAMAGIVRGRLLNAGLIGEQTITPDMVTHCSGFALTNALIGVRPVSHLDSRAIPLHKGIAELSRFIQLRS